MITSFRVGAIFQIQDQATPVVARLASEMQKLATLTATVRTELASISSVRIGSLTNRVTALTGAFDRGATAATAMSASVTAGAATMDTGLGAALVTARALTAQLTAAGRAGAGIRGPRGGGGGPPALPPPLPGAGGGGRGGGGHGRGPFHFGRIGTHAGPMHASVGGTGAAIGTGVGLWGVAHVMKEAQEPLHQESMLRLLGLDDAQIKQVTDRARATATAVPGSGFASNMASMGEMYSVVGLQGSLQLSQRMAEVDRVMALSGKGKEEGSSYVLTRAGELMGQLTDPTTHQVDLQKFGGILDTMSRVVVATHGKVTPAEWLNYAKQAGPASGALTEEGFYTTATIMQAMGGNRAGTAAAAIARQFAGGVMTKSKADELKRIGIFQEGDYTVERGGHVQFKEGAAANLVQRFQRDPLAAVTEVLAPALSSHGFSKPEDFSRELYKIIGTGPAQREVFDLLRNPEQIRQERERAMQALPPGTALPLAAEHDPTQAMAGFTKAFNDMLGAVGSPAMTAAVPALNGLTSLFNGIAAWAGAHKAAAGVVGGIGAGAAGGAALGLGIGWLGGPIGAGGGALLGAGAGAGVALWNTLPGSVTSGAARGAAFGGMTGIPGAAAIGGMTGGLWGALPAIIPGAAGTQSQAAPITNNNNVTVSVKAETDRPATLAEMIVAEINKLMSQGHLRNQGEADSTGSSPYVTGAGVP